MKLQMILLIAGLGFSVKSCAQIDNGIKIRNINEAVSDTFFHRSNDTIYQVIYDPIDKDLRINNYYLKKNDKWYSYFEGGSIREEGRFKKEYFGIRFALKRKKYETFKQGGKWKYFNTLGELIKENSF